MNVGAVRQVRGKIVLRQQSWNCDRATVHNWLLVFRRDDTRKRINISSDRYGYDKKVINDIASAFSPAGARDLPAAEAEIDDDGDVRRLFIVGETVSYSGQKVTFPDTAIEFEKPSEPEPHADIVAYRQCVETVQQQLRFIGHFSKLVDHPKSGTLASDGEIIVSLFERYRRETLESLAIHFRKVFELVMYACWTAFEPRMSLSYDTWQIRNVHDHLKRQFPSVKVFMEPIYGDSFRPIPANEHASFTADELIEAYKQCGDVLHTSTPYRKPFDGPGFLQTTIEWSRRLKLLLALHRVQIGPDEFVFCRSQPDGKMFIWIDTEVPRNTPAGAF